MLNALWRDYSALTSRVESLEQRPMTLAQLQADYAALGARVDALRPKPSARIKASDLELTGGYRIAQDFARCGMAIDFASRRVFASGHAQQNVIHEYALPDKLGTGPNVMNWPILRRVKTHQNFWGDEPGGWGHGFPGGQKVTDGVLWISAKVYYETAPKKLTLYGKNLTTGEILRKPTTLSQPAFGGGFIKGANESLLGCGGYESGQGAVVGPTCAKEDSTILLNQASLNYGNWENKAPRPPNYSIAPNNPSWVGESPRNGEGRWCCDRVYGGGIWRTNGLMYWAILGIGLLSYAHQSEVFSIGDTTKECWLYTYDPKTFAKSSVAFEKWPHGMVHGQDIDSEGTIYLHTRDEWSSGMYKVDSAIKVFRNK